MTPAERAILKAVVELDAEHYEDRQIKGCAMCWPKDGSWPCVSRLIADDLRAVVSLPKSGMVLDLEAQERLWHASIEAEDSE